MRFDPIMGRTSWIVPRGRGVRGAATAISLAPSPKARNTRAEPGRSCRTVLAAKLEFINCRWYLSDAR